MIKNFLVGLGLMSFIFIAGGIGGTIDTTDFKEGIVLDNCDGYAIIETIDGNTWEYTECKAHQGDRVRATFFNNGTYNNIYDDEIISIKVLDK